MLTRRAHVFVVFLLSQLVSSALLLVVVTLWPDAISWPAVGGGAAAGLAGVVGTSLLYQGLAIGRMSVVAPITAVLGAGLPVLFGVAAGERPGPIALIGIITGLVAVVVITRAPEPPATQTGASRVDPPAVRAAARSRQAVICAFGAGVGFGLFFVLLDHAPVDSGLWPLLGPGCDARPTGSRQSPRTSGRRARSANPARCCRSRSVSEPSPVPAAGCTADGNLGDRPVRQTISLGGRVTWSSAARPAAVGACRRTVE